MISNRKASKPALSKRQIHLINSHKPKGLYKKILSAIKNKRYDLAMKAQLVEKHGIAEVKKVFKEIKKRNPELDYYNTMVAVWKQLESNQPALSIHEV
ncbi:MAG: hypothetical protein WCI04_05230 [archaeon]